MAISNFDKHLLIEQIRYIETEHQLVCDSEAEYNDHSLHLEFEARLWRRARCLVEQHGLTPVLKRAARLSGYLKSVALILSVLLGGLGVFYAVIDEQSINIYWLLLVLLGFNLVSMLLWLAGISLHIDGLATGVLVRLTSWLPTHLETRASDRTKQGRNTYRTLADRAWLACNFTGAVGKWQFSKITHQLWLSYLLAGLLFLVLLLMVRQYDFVWGTTLLSDTVFVTMTEGLSRPLQALGFTVPTADQVQATRIGGAGTLTAELRYVWAQFLLGSLFCYGIVPRILMWSWSAIMCRRARRHFTLDYYLPYYISLRQRLMPLASHGQVIDADVSPAIISDSPSRTPEPHALPAGTVWVAVELGDAMNWPPDSVNAENDLGQVTDRESFSRIHQTLQDNDYPVIAVAVSAMRSPDRGVRRTVSGLLSCSEQRWLVLLQKYGDEPISNKRLSAWYRLAEASDVPADHVISLSLV